MEKPDTEGFINITWPSKNVPHGGIFHTRSADPSAEQQQFLKLLLEESKFNLKLRESHTFGLRACNEEGTRVGAPRASARAPTTRPQTSCRRSLSAIRSSGVLDVDMYRPLNRGEDRELMKEQLANAMAHGDSTEQAPPAMSRRLAKPTPKIPTAKETWNDLVTQIRERAEWLAEMEWLGQAAPHREIVQEQIAERMRALDALGVDSACSTARSTAHSLKHSTSHSTKHSTSHSSKHSSARSSAADPQITVRSASVKTGAPKKPLQPSAKRLNTAQENVSAYSQLSPLGYSPRRRV